MNITKVEISRDINKEVYPKIKIDGLEIPVKEFAVGWDVNHNSIGTIYLAMHLKRCEISFDGTVVINGFPVTDKIGRQIYETLKTKYGE